MWMSSWLSPPRGPALLTTELQQRLRCPAATTATLPCPLPQSPTAPASGGKAAPLPLRRTPFPASAAGEAVELAAPRSQSWGAGCWAAAPSGLPLSPFSSCVNSPPPPQPSRRRVRTWQPQSRGEIRFARGGRPSPACAYGVCVYIHTNMHDTYVRACTSHWSFPLYRIISALPDGESDACEVMPSGAQCAAVRGADVRRRKRGGRSTNGL